MTIQRVRYVWCFWKLTMAAAVAHALVCPSFAQAGKLIASDVQHDNGRFTVHSNILIALPASHVREILTDFENLPRINRNIKDVAILAPYQDGTIRMRIASNVCALFVCLDYRWVQSVTILPSGDIVTRFDPDESDFREGWVRYQLLSEGAHTRLITDAVLVPDFWFPPVIGPILIKSKLRHESLDTATGIETVNTRARHAALGAEPWLAMSTSSNQK